MDLHRYLFLALWETIAVTLSINFETGARERKTRREEMTPMAALYGNERLGEGKRVSWRGLGRGRGESGREPGC